MKNITKNDAGFAAVVGAIISVLVLVLVGLLVYYKTVASLGGGLPSEGVTALANINSTANTTFSLAPIIAIVLIASVILGAVMGFGRTGGNP